MCQNDSSNRVIPFIPELSPDLFVIICKGKPVARIDPGGTIHYIDKEKLREGLAVFFKDNSSSWARIAWAYIENALK